jgi:hypothetical protein
MQSNFSKPVQANNKKTLGVRQMEIANLSIFDNLEEPVVAPVALTQNAILSPFEVLKQASGPLVIRYKPRTERSTVPFMDFKRKADRSFLDMLLRDIEVIWLKSATDRVLMNKDAAAKRSTGHKQT